MRRWIAGTVRILSWAAGSSLAGAVIGLAVGFFGQAGLEAPTIVISILFGNVVGLTAMVSATFLFPRLRGLTPPLRLALLGLALVSGAVAGTLAVLVAYPLFVFRDPRQALAIAVINGLLALIVGGVVYGYEEMHLRLQETLREVEEGRLLEARLREEAARAELAALQARINPHFFFNTLNTISSLLDEDPRRAEEVVQTLADLFRYTFKVAGSGLVPLDEEIRFTRNYLAIEQARFGDRLRVEWDIEPATLDERVPGLIVQPLVENAVGHGLAPLAGGGTLRVGTRLAGEALHIEVLDDGVGLTGPPGERVREGHGLGNVERRLDAYYGSAGHLALEPNPAGRGTVARLAIPAGEPARPRLSRPTEVDR